MARMPQLVSEGIKIIEQIILLRVGSHIAIVSLVCQNAMTRQDDRPFRPYFVRAVHVSNRPL